MPSDAMAPDRVWSSLPTRRLRQFGAALDPATNGQIPKLQPVTVPVRKLRGSPACPACGNSGPWQCACPEDEE